MKFKLILSILLLNSMLQAQTFELIGPRSLSFSGWDFPTSENLYFDSGGTLFHYIREASQPRSNELLRYNDATNTWTNLTNNTFSVPGGSGVSGGVPMPDGSIFTITRTFSNALNNQHFAYTIQPNGTAVSLPAHPLPMNSDAGLDINPVQGPNGDIYYSHQLFNTRFGKWDGVQWTELPDLAGNTANVSGIGVDENNDVYAVNPAGTSGLTAMEFNKFNSATNNWDLLHTTPQTDVDEGRVYAISSNEIYMYYSTYHFSVGSMVHVTQFDGTNFTPLGNPISAVDFSSFAMIKSQTTGELYLAVEQEGGGNGFLHTYNAVTNNWDALPNDIADGGLLVGFAPTLAERNGCIYVSSYENAGLTTVKYTEPISNCPPFLTLNNTTISSGLYKAANTITTINAVNIQSGGDVNFEAGQCILLGAGFEVPALTQFSASIDGCN